MRVKAIGVMRMSGISKQTGASYDFAQLMYLRKIEPTSNDKFKVQGLGYEAGKLDLEIDALHKFNDINFPADLDLSTDQIPQRNGIKTIVTGFASEQKAGVKVVA